MDDACQLPNYQCLCELGAESTQGYREFVSAHSQAMHETFKRYRIWGATVVAMAVVSTLRAVLSLLLIEQPDSCNFLRKHLV